MRRDMKIKSTTCHQFVLEHVSYMVAETMDRYAWSLLANCAIGNVIFDLWMLAIGFNTFCIVMNFINDTC